MSKILAIDFDGTIADHRYPDIGEEVPHAFTTMLDLLHAGHRLILYTMRSGMELQQAVHFCEQRGVEFWGVNKNPEQHTWTQSRKVYAHYYIDDAALGIQLIDNPDPEWRPMVDWLAVRANLVERGLLNA